MPAVHPLASHLSFAVRKAPDNRSWCRPPMAGEIEVLFQFRDPAQRDATQAGHAGDFVRDAQIDLSGLGQWCDWHGDLAWYLGDVAAARRHLLALGLSEEPTLFAAYDRWAEEERRKLRGV